MLYGICKEQNECSCGLCEAISDNSRKPIASKPWWDEDEPIETVKVSNPQPLRRVNFAIGRLAQTKQWIRGGAITCGWCGYIHDPRADCEAALPDCGSYRSSRWMNTCRVCSKQHELPQSPAHRWAFRYYPEVPTAGAIRQWKRRTREHVIRQQYAAAQAMEV